MDVEGASSRVSFPSILGRSVDATFAEGPLNQRSRGAASSGVVSHGLRLRRCDHCLVGSTVLLFGAGSPAIGGAPNG